MNTIGPIIQIYGQDAWHDSVYIVANKEGLQALQRAIEKALLLSNGQEEVSSSDGEGYDICVMKRDEDKLIKFTNQYTAEYTQSYSKDKLKPWEEYGKV